MIHITETAQTHFSKLLEKQKLGTQIRLFVVNPGTPSAECGVSYCSPDAIEETDIEIKFKKFSAYVDEISAPFLEDTEIDFITNQLESQLTLKAPHAKILKAHTDASLIEQVKHVIQSEIYPQLAKHGGQVSLIEITNDGYAILQFSGGCNGCSMVDVTLKEGIEKKLLYMFPYELKGVKDLTEHKKGNHSYTNLSQ